MLQGLLAGGTRRAAMSASVTTTGRITQILGPVVDVEFPPGGLPEVYSALKITNAAMNRVVKTGRSIRELALERGLLDRATLDRVLSVDAMTRGGIVGQEGRE